MINILGIPSYNFEYLPKYLQNNNSRISKTNFSAPKNYFCVKKVGICRNIRLNFIHRHPQSSPKSLGGKFSLGPAAELPSPSTAPAVFSGGDADSSGSGSASGSVASFGLPLPPSGAALTIGCMFTTFPLAVTNCAKTLFIDTVVIAMVSIAIMLKVEDFLFLNIHLLL
jgi:hypothetical protein